MLRTRANDIRLTGRAAQGVRLINIDDADRVVGLAKLDEKEAAEVDSLPPADDGGSPPPAGW